MERHIQAMADHWSKLLLICLLLMINTQVLGASDFVNITFVNSAVPKGAVCLDGSPPAYFHAQGSGDGVNNWLIYLEGGAWCESTSECLIRAAGWLGSSYSRTDNKTYFNGFLTQNQTYNPDFYNWNRVYLVYCDGSSFMGDVEVKTNLTFRGARVFNAIIEDLLAKGMANANNVVLTGSSAGGLATILHCDSFRALVPNASRVKCISDSGFFIHAEDLPGAKAREDFFTEVAELHGIAKFLPESCTSKMNPGLCLFPENLVGDIQTPLFLLESSFDAHQIKENLVPSVGGKPEWSNCTQNLTLCTSTQLEIMKDFQTAFIETLQELDNSSSRGMFVHTCYLHTHLLEKEGWKCSSVVDNVLGNKTIAKAIGDWYFDRIPFQQIDTTNNVPRNCTSTLAHDTFNKKCIHPMN
ncbi:hypothetical protein Pfo_025152 [Paulownia fortunei]|nr:hypothetical protein Pfo_025152 [Paulownia fortunei]